MELVLTGFTVEFSSFFTNINFCSPSKWSRDEKKKAHSSRREKGFKYLDQWTPKQTQTSCPVPIAAASQTLLRLESRRISAALSLATNGVLWEA